MADALAAAQCRLLHLVHIAAKILPWLNSCQQDQIWLRHATSKTLATIAAGALVAVFDDLLSGMTLLSRAALIVPLLLQPSSH
jgi:hypothetical protein